MFLKTITVRAKIRIVLFTVTVGSFAISFACGSESSNLESISVNPTVAPCVMLTDSEVDPCENRGGFWDVQRGVYPSYARGSFGQTPFNMYNELKWLASSCPNGYCQPQFFVRATVIPGSIRCSKNNASLTNANDGSLQVNRRPTDDLSTNHWNCFVDVKVNEYVFGSGPGHIQVNVGKFRQDPTTESDYDIQDYAHGRWGVGILEGREFIIALRRPLDATVVAWAWSWENTWDVQRTDHGEIVVVSYWGREDVYGPQNFTMSLSDFRVMTREAMGRYYRETGGRLGTTGRNPMAATDAGRDQLLKQLREFGGFSVDGIIPVTPIPAPGEDDLYTPGQNILDPTITATVEVPGGLTDFDTPTPIIEDEPTATATEELTATPTEEPTATATTADAVEDTPTPEPTATPEQQPTVTPEPAPTPEPTQEPTVTPAPAPTSEPADTPTPESEQPLAPGAEETPEDPLAPGSGDGNAQPGAGPGA